MPKAGSGGNEQYTQATSPVNPSIGDSWYDGTRQRIFTNSGWILIDTILDQAVATIGQPQLKVVQDTQGVSSTVAGGIAISGLSISCTSSAVYRVQGKIMYQMSAADAFSLGMAMLAGSQVIGSFKGANATGVSAPRTETFNQDSTGNLFSATVAVAASTIGIDLEALIQTSATAGGFQINGLVSAAAKTALILRGSYIQAFRLQ